MSSLIADARPTALLALADGTVFRGRSVGADGHTIGEVVFNTAITGYQEILTDPSYCRQIVTLTYPHIGNTGVNAEDVESHRVFAAGLIVRDVPPRALELPRGRVARRLPAAREHRRRSPTSTRAGSRASCATRARRPAAISSRWQTASKADERRAVELARSFPGMAGPRPRESGVGREVLRVDRDRVALGRGYGRLEDPKFHVVAFDYGVKRNILRMLAARGCRITVLPAQTPAAEALRLKPDGIFLPTVRAIRSPAITRSRRRAK